MIVSIKYLEVGVHGNAVRQLHEAVVIDEHLQEHTCQNHCVLLEGATMTECIQKCRRCVTIHMNVTSLLRARAARYQLAVLKATLHVGLSFNLFYFILFFPVFT